MCPAITEEVAAGRFCGEKKKGSDGRNSAEAVVFAIGNPVEPGATKNFLICGPSVRGWGNFLVEGTFNFFGFL